MLNSVRRFWLALLLAFFVLSGSPAYADVRSSTDPDPSANTVLAHIQAAGSRLYYLGHDGNLDGWLIIKDGQIQIAYTSADQKTALMGAMFGAEGQNISAQQIHALMTRNKEVQDLLAKGNPALASAQTVIKSSPPAPPDSVKSPGEKLMENFAAASGVIMGNNADAPELFMVMDPNCPHCQATWRALRETVIAGKLRLHLIPIGNQEGENERAAAMLLRAADPLSAWDKYVAGDKMQLSGTPDSAAMAAIRTNHELMVSWNIHLTPYLAYRGKDGKVKVLQGEPQKISTVLSDLL